MDAFIYIFSTFTDPATQITTCASAALENLKVISLRAMPIVSSCGSILKAKSRHLGICPGGWRSRDLKGLVRYYQ